MANWNNPTLTSTYTNFVTEVKDRDVEAAVWFEGMSPTNLPTNAKRLNTTTGRFEKWNGSAWVDAVATFTFPALLVAGVATFNGNTTIGDAGTDTLTVNAAATFGAGATFSGLARFNGNVTLGDAAADAVTVNATLSFATAPVLTPGTANAVMFLNGSKVVSAGSVLVFDGTNLGLGVTPITGGGRLQLANGQNITFQGTFGNISANGTFTDTWRYITNAGASNYYQNAGQHIWQTAPFGTAGNAISFTQAMTLDASGNLGVGTASPHINSVTINRGTESLVRLQSSVSGNTASDGVLLSINSANEGYLWNYENAPFIFGTNNTERARIDSSGNLTANASVTGHWQVPRGTTAQRAASPASGMIRFNTSLSRYEGHNGTAWSSIGGGATGGGTDDVFHENGQTVTTNYTLTTNKNAMSAGPVTIASGITVTVPSGSNWVVV